LQLNCGTASSLTLALRVDLTNGIDQIFGTISDGAWVSEVFADRNVFDARFNPAQQAGSRAFILERADATPADAASAVSRINTAGSTHVRGRLMDGRPFATASSLAKNGDFPFYLSLHHGSEVLIGWLNFPAGQQPLSGGTVLWVNAGTNSFATALQVNSVP